MKLVIKKIMLGFSALLVTTGFAAVVTVAPVSAQNTAVCEGVGLTDEGTGCEESADSEQTFGAIIKRIINIFSIVVGAVSVIMIIIGGFRYIISNGDSNGITGAKNAILYAIVGLVIVLFAQVIVRFVLSNATGATTP